MSAGLYQEAPSMVLQAEPGRIDWLPVFESVNVLPGIAQFACPFAGKAVSPGGARFIL